MSKNKRTSNVSLPLSTPQAAAGGSVPQEVTVTGKANVNSKEVVGDITGDSTSQVIASATGSDGTLVAQVKGTQEVSPAGEANVNSKAVAADDTFEQRHFAAFPDCKNLIKVSGQYFLEKDRGSALSHAVREKCEMEEIINENFKVSINE
jgi:hypothetical protein